MSKRISLFAALAIFVLGYVNLASAASILTFTGSEDPGNLLSYTADDATAPIDHQYPFPDISNTPIFTGTHLFFLSDVSITDPSSGSEAVSGETLPAVQDSVDDPAPAPAATESDPLLAESSTASVGTLEADIDHVVIISIDGMRPDAFDRADTPNLDELRDKGAYSPHAQTINPSYTLPSHISMLNGVQPQKHGVVEALPCIGCRLNIGPTLFSLAHDAGLSTGMAFGKEKLNYLVLPNSVDMVFGVDAHDLEVKAEAIEFIEQGLSNILFVHLPDTDRVGHAFGWLSPNQLSAVTYADGMVGEIVAALDREGYLDSTLLIITADHGGHDFKHGLDCPEDRTIPWLAVGPGVPQGVTLNGDIRTVDTAATAAYALGLPIPEHWDGRPVLEIFQ